MKKSGVWLMVLMVGLVFWTVPAPAYLIGYDMEQTVLNPYYPASYGDQTGMANVLSGASSSDYNAGVLRNGAVQSAEQVKFGHYSGKFGTSSANLNPRPNAGLELTGSNAQMTVMSQVYLDGSTDGMHVVASSRGGTGSSWLLYVNWGYLIFGTNSDTTSYAEHAVYSQRLQPNSWYHVATTFDQGVVKYYLNGTLIDTWTAANTTMPYDSNAYGMIGTSYGWGGDLHGYLDDFYFNSEAALSANQIAYYSANSIVPEPMTLGFMLLGLASMVSLRRRVAR